MNQESPGFSRGSVNGGMYHYTCSHRAAGIRACGEIRPNHQPLLPDIPVVWLTTLDVPDRRALGLTSETLTCDRTQWRVTVRAGSAEPWHVFARRHRVHRDVRDALEAGRSPMLWWVAADPIPVDTADIRRMTDVRCDRA